MRNTPWQVLNGVYNVSGRFLNSVSLCTYVCFFSCHVWKWFLGLNRLNLAALFLTVAEMFGPEPRAINLPLIHTISLMCTQTVLRKIFIRRLNA